MTSVPLSELNVNNFFRTLVLNSLLLRQHRQLNHLIRLMLKLLGRSSFNVCLVLGGFQMPALHEGRPMMENFTEDIH